MTDKLKTRSCICCGFLVTCDDPFSMNKPLTQNERDKFTSNPDRFGNNSICFQQQWNRRPWSEEWKSRVILDESLRLEENNPLHYVQDHKGRWVNLLIHKCRLFHRYNSFVVQHPEYISYSRQAKIEKRRFLTLVFIGIFGLFFTIDIHLFD